MKNPLFQSSFKLPFYSKIKPKHIVPAITESVQNCRKLIKTILTKNIEYNWKNFCQPLLEVENCLDRIMSTLTHLNNVKNIIEFRKEYKIALNIYYDYNNWFYQNKDLYKAFNILKESISYINLNQYQKKLIHNILLDFQLSGINLNKKEQENYSKINIRLNELSTIFSNNVLDSMQEWSKHIVSKKELIGIPKNILNNAMCNAKNQGKKGWLLTLDLPIYISVMKYAENANLRKEIYIAYSTIASDIGLNSGKFDNGPIMLEILTLRYKLSKLLGFKSFAEKSLAKKMFKKPIEVIKFLNSLVDKILPKGKLELKKLSDFIKQKYNINKLNPWDLHFYSEKQKQYIYNINDEKLSIYFSEKNVINGLFKIVNKIYSISIKERFNIDLWNKDVRFFDVFDKNNKLQGSFYLDLYVRKNKRNGAWMDEFTCRMRKLDGSIQLPIAYLICNFNKPLKNKPALFNYDEIITLFHEFGHCLHHILINIEIKNISSINSVPWDIVEIPSQLMEKWCWEYDSISLFSKHYKTKKPIPKDILLNIIAGKNFNYALFMLRQLELCLFDLYLHINFNPLEQNTNQIFRILYECRKKVMLLPIVKSDRFPNSFTHIFSGGYASGYYSYLWADVLASNIFTKFKKDGIFNKITGNLFLNNILSKNFLEDPLTILKDFFGKNIKLDNFLKSYGIK